MNPNPKIVISLPHNHFGYLFPSLYLSCIQPYVVQDTRRLIFVKITFRGTLRGGALYQPPILLCRYQLPSPILFIIILPQPVGLLCNIIDPRPNILDRLLHMQHQLFLGFLILTEFLHLHYWNVVFKHVEGDVG